MNKKEIIKWSKLILLYGLIFLMLNEWLYPIMELTNTGHAGMLILFIIICLITNIMNLSAIWSVPIKIAYIIWFILYVHEPAQGDLLESVTSGMRAIFTGNWMDISDSVKSILFLILLWMTIYLIHHWLMIRRSITLFFIITVIFLALLDTFTKYDASMSIVRTMIFGLLLTGLLFAEKTITDNQMKSNFSNYGKLLIPLLLLITLSAIFALAMPKKQATENLPGPIEQVVQWANSNISTTGKIGYVENDDKLGGDFERDSAPVLQYTAKNPQYMRVESKSTYTGRGWTRASDEVFVTTFNYKEDVRKLFPAGRKNEELTMSVKMQKKYDFLIQPYGVKQITRSNEKQNQFYIEVDSGKIRAITGKDKKVKTLLEYDYLYNPPLYKERELNASRISMLKKDDGLTAAQKKEYLQIPKTVPERVAALTEDITKDEKSVYGKAQAIVKYFETSGYTYSNVDVGFPENGEDYIDRFLFDTKIGYCDNFSSSMAIMLRSIGIPTRWVKGFSAGEKMLNEKAKDGYNKYEITNNNAHSWVEVYIPEVGWMSFEPTIGFDGFDDQIEDDTKEAAAPENDIVKEKEAAEKEEQATAERKQQEKLEKEQQKEDKKEPEKTEQAPAKMLWLWIALAAIGIILLVLAIIKRKALQQKYLIWYYNKRQPTIDQAYKVIEKRLLKAHRIERKPGETLNEFAKRVDWKLRTTDMTKFMNLLEQDLYNPNSENTKWSHFKEYWENLINKTRG